MTSPPIARIEINGHPATVEELSFPALVNYGHFTALQARAWRVRGLDTHLTRLEVATRELYGTDLDAQRVRDHLRHALSGGTGDAALRVTVFQPDPDARVSVMVAVRPPAEAPDAPQSLLSVAYQRPVPHIKHIGGFGQIYHRGVARAKGYHDALLTGADGVVCETATANVGFFDGHALVWPDAPALYGTTMQLLDRTLPVPVQRRPVRLADLATFQGAFVANSVGIAAVDRIDDIALPVPDDVMAVLARAWAAVPWDTI